MTLKIHEWLARCSFYLLRKMPLLLMIYKACLALAQLAILCGAFLLWSIYEGPILPFYPGSFLSSSFNSRWKISVPLTEKKLYAWNQGERRLTFFLSMTNCTQRRYLNFRSSFHESSWDSFLSKQTSFYFSWVSCAIFTYYCWLNCLETSSATSYCVNYHRRKPNFILSIFETLCCVLTNKLGILEDIKR